MGLETFNGVTRGIKLDGVFHKQFGDLNMYTFLLYVSCICRFPMVNKQVRPVPAGVIEII